MQNIFKKLYNEQIAKRSISEIVVRTLVVLLFAMLAFSYVYILFWAFMSSLKTHAEVVLKPFALPEVPQWGNYKEVFSALTVADTSFAGMVFNSIYFSIGGGLISMFSTCLLAYATTKYKFWGASFYPIATFISITLPIYGTGGSIYEVFHALGFINSYTFVFTAVGGIGMNYMYFSALFKGISNSYMEAAELDGANEFQIYFHIMLPQARPLFWSLFLLAWLGQWNDVGNGLLYLRKLPQLSVGLYLFEKDMIYNARKDILYAGCVLCAIPPLLLFVFFTDVLTSNVSLGGIKE